MTDSDWERVRFNLAKTSTDGLFRLVRQVLIEHEERRALRGLFDFEAQIGELVAQRLDIVATYAEQEIIGCELRTELAQREGVEAWQIMTAG